MVPSFIFMSEKLRKVPNLYQSWKVFNEYISMHKSTFISRIRELFTQYFVSKL